MDNNEQKSGIEAENVHEKTNEASCLNEGLFEASSSGTNKAEELNAGLFAPSKEPSVKESAAVLDGDVGSKCCKKNVLKIVIAIALLISISFSSAFGGMALILHSSIFRDSDFFDAFIAKWAGVVQNRVEVDQISGEYVSDSIALAEKALNTSVRIRIVETVAGSMKETSSGSGIIYAKSPSGILGLENKYTVVTNYHVVYGSEKFLIETYDGKRYNGTIKHLDEQSDIAVVEFESVLDLPCATQGDSDNLKSGQSIIVAGNPLGHGFGVSFGYISNPYKVSSSNNNVPLITLDAAVNPGNSGGGVYDSQGNLVGLVVSKASGNDVDGIGYAIPVNTVNEVVNDLLTWGYVKGRPALGITIVGVYNLNTYSALMEGGLSGYLFDIDDKEEKYGVYIIESRNSALKKGDRIIQVDGEGIAIADDISAALLGKLPGDKIKVVVERATDMGDTVEYRQYTLDVTMIERDFPDENK